MSKPADGIEVEKLWDTLSKVFEVRVAETGNEWMKPEGLSIPSGFKCETRPVKYFVRHHTKSDIYRITLNNGRFIETTDDHTIMLMTSPWRISPQCRSFAKMRCSSDRVGDLMLTVDSREFLDSILKDDYKIASIEKIGQTDEYVYDLEMEGDDEDSHTYYANGVWVHNSQFVSLEPIVKVLARQNGIDENTFFKDHTDEFKKEVIKIFDDLIYNEINPFVADLINTNCHTTQGHRLRYSHEYTTDLAYYQAKKCYLVHIIETEGKYVDKWKQSGIRIKKLGIPVKIKGCLKHIYYTTLQDEKFGERQYLDYLDTVYRDIYEMDFEEIAQFSNYKTEKQAVAFCQSVKGAGGVPRAVNNYNDIIKREKLDYLYPSIQVGDEIQWVYIDPANKYGIDVIAFKGRFPKELKSIFKVDAYKMFDKLINNTLERFNEILKYTRFRPGLCSKEDLDLL